MNDFFGQEIGLEMWVVVAVGVLLLIVLGVLVWVIFSFRDLKQPKFGFGGKPLNILAILLLAILLPTSIFVVQQRVRTAQEAARLNDASLTIFEVSDYETESDVSFSATPIAQGKAWGEDKTFNMTWTITGPEVITYEETNRTSEYPSYFVLSLNKGTYTVSVRLVSEGFDVTKTTQYTVD